MNTESTKTRCAEMAATATLRWMSMLLMVLAVGLLLSASVALGSDSNIEEAQSTLTKRGYDPGPADGYWGTRTETAVRKFQVDNGLDVTGALDAPTLAALGVTGPAQEELDRSYLIPFANIGWKNPVSAGRSEARGGLRYWAETTGDMITRPGSITILKSGATTGEYGGDLNPVNIGMPRIGGITRFVSRGDNHLRSANGGIVLVVGDTLQVGSLVWAGQEISSGVVVIRDDGLDLLSFK